MTPRILIAALVCLSGAWAPAGSMAPTCRAVGRRLPPLQATPTLGRCTVTGTQSAGPARVEVGGVADMTITLTADCPVEAPGRADIMLALDHSGSMASEGKAVAAREAIHEFVDRVDFDRDRVGVVAFNESAYVAQALTTRADRVLSALDDIGLPRGGTYVASAIDAADRELEASGRPDAAAIIVLLTDGLDDEGAMLAAARRAHAHGRILMVIALGVDAAQASLRRVASAESYYHYAPGPGDLTGIYREIATIILTFTVADARLTDRLAPDMAYVPGSGDPDEPSQDGELVWRRSTLSSFPTVIRYAVRIGRSGSVQPSAAVWVDYLDGDGERRQQPIRPAIVLAVPPVIHYAYLPATYRDQCIPAVRWADVALTLDNSDSMKGEKLAQAVAAARTFVSLLHLPSDQAAIVTYDAEGRIVQGLSGDPERLAAALDGIASGSGTRIDRGLEAAMDALAGPARRPDNRAVIVLLSDGIQVEERGRPLEVAAAARQRGIDVFTIALGEDADRDMLRAIAMDPTRAYHAPAPSDLEAIYRRIAGQVVCR
jgi:Mg-chelatase subunit ChlD